SNPRSVDVPPGGTGATTFEVSCEGLTGDLDVTTETTGEDLDTEYSIVVDGGAPVAIGANTTETIEGLDDGSRTVELTDVADNCTVSGSNPRSVDVPPGGTGATTFTVTCEEITGSIMVTTTTTGTPDPDGYFVVLDSGTPVSIDDATPVTFTDLSPTSHDVELSGLDGTCAVVPPPSNPTSPTVVGGDTVSVDFNIDCP
ncbi:MAG: hypothetical protein ACODAB_03805, partial [Gemmatimonadota bacterium]